MELNHYLGLLIFMLCFVPKTVQSQSSMEFQSGSHIEVQSGADICADNMIIIGTFSGGGTQCANALNPVELTSFAATLRQNVVELQWNTATEVESYGFEIERRTMGTNGVWGKIAFLPGVGTSNSVHEYSFTDQKLSPGRYVYRIKQVDMNGSFKYYGNAEVEILAPSVFSLDQNYPNPFNPSTQISFSIPKDVFVSLKIFDLIGRETATLVSEELSAGSYTRTWNAANMPSGIYFYRITAGLYTMTKKLVLMR